MKTDDTNAHKIAAIIVTFNRKEFLPELLDSFSKQTYPLNFVIIIDNSTNFEILDLLNKIGVIRGKTDESLIENWEKEGRLGEIKVLYIKTAQNIGGAGGFSLGLKRAYEKGFELFWLMDDDVKPLPQALEYQLKFLDISKCITPSKRALDGEILHWWGWLDLKTLREKPIPEENYRKEYAEINMACFEGLLIHRDIVSKIGFPNPEFFIYGDDVVYGYKASQHTKCIYLLKPTFIKKLKKKNFHKRFGKYYPFASRTLAYYLMRNYLLKANEIKSVTPDKINMLFVYSYHFYYYLKQMLKAAFIEWDLKKLWILTKGFVDSFGVGFL